MEKQDSIRSKARRLRLSAGLSQSALGRAAKIERTRLSQFESGYLDLKPAELDRLQRKLFASLAAHVEGIAREVCLEGVTA